MHQGDLTADTPRVVKIYGALSNQRIQRVWSEIKQYNSQSARPISLYINSAGGKTNWVDGFDDFFEATPSRRQPAPLITIAHARARSSAAYLLVLGDYACAYEWSELHLHGVRYPGPKPGEEITREKATVMALRLDEKNRLIAQKLSHRVVRRLAYRHHALHRDATASPFRRPAGAMAWLDQFLQSLAARISAETYRNLFCETAAHFKSIFPDTTPTAKHSAKSIRPADTQAARLHFVIQRQREHNSRKDWIIDESVLADIMLDYTLLEDFFAADFVRTRAAYARQYGSWLLSSGASISNSSSIAQSRLELLWGFSYFLCWRLLIGEHTILPVDAYWTGLIDEVNGTGLAGKRPFGPIS